MASAKPQRTPIARPWMMAGLVGVAVGVAMAYFRPFSMLPVSLEVGLMIGWGWTAMLAFCPWRQAAGLREDRQVMHRFARHLERIATGGERRPLKSFLIDQDDEVGRLGQAIHDVLAASIEHRVRAGRLERSMDDTIRRETAKATAQLHRQAMTDSLTGLANRRALDDDLAQIFSLPGQSVSAIAIDIDHFKSVNDTLGHQVGDTCLAFLGRLLQSHFRHSEMAYRCGGDEFVVLLPGAEFDDAKGAAERLLQLFGQMPWQHDAPRPTLSIGVAATISGATDNPQQLLQMADTALYASKRSGRGRVMTYHDAA